MNNGYFFVYRKLFAHDLAKDPLFVALWVKLLSMASYEDGVVPWNTGTVVVKKGELVTSVLALSRWLKVSRVTTDCYLDSLQKLHQINIKKTNKYTVISIKNWNKYQIDDNRTTTKTTTERQQNDNNSIYKEDKNNIDKSILGKKPQREKSVFGNEEIDKILTSFKELTGHIPADKYPRRVAQNMRQMTKGLLGKYGDDFRALRGEELTATYVYEKFWINLAQKKYSQDFEKLETVKGRFKVYLDDISGILTKEKKYGN